MRLDRYRWYIRKVLVSIHALTRSATCLQCNLSFPDLVSIHALTRSATECYHYYCVGGWFQSTHSRGVRLTSPQFIRSENEFQSTHSRGVRRGSKGWSGRDKQFQSTHSRGVRHASHGALDVTGRFQSTHSRGVRRHGSRYLCRVCQFQSTHSRGVRRTQNTTCYLISCVSIHALTRSATAYIFSFLFSDI